MTKHLKMIGLVAIVLMVGAALTLAGTGQRAWLGVYTQEVDRDLAEAFDLASTYGAIVNDVVDDSPADEAGLKDDDIITAFNGHKVTDDEDLIDYVAEAKPGDDVTLTVLRDGKEITITAELGERSHDLQFFFSDDAPHAPRAPRAPKAPHVWHFYDGDNDDDDDHAYELLEWFGNDRAFIGVSLINMSDELADAFGATNGGVLIDAVEDDSPAEKAGLKAGDIIVSIDNEDVSESSDIQELIWEMDEGDVAAIDIIRDKKSQSMKVAVDLREGKYFGNTSSYLHLPDLPKIDIRAPRMKGLHKGFSIDIPDFDRDELSQAMDELQKELQKLKKELKEIHQKLK